MSSVLSLLHSSQLFFQHLLASQAECLMKAADLTRKTVFSYLPLWPVEGASLLLCSTD